eukprot:scaffold2192_cov170-Amphora_coffeaeformis.AAC.21
MNRPKALDGSIPPFWVVLGFFLLLLTVLEDHHKGKAAVPDTTGVVEGSAKRNIQRKHGDGQNQKEKKNHGGALGGKGNWDPLDDGSTP